MPSTPSPFSASTTQDAAAQALAGGWASCCFNSGSTEKSFDGDAKVLLLEFRKLSPHLQKVWRTLKSSSDLTKILPEGVVVNPSGRVIKLSLYKKELDGEISPLVGQLTELKSLNLAKKYLHGGIPESIVCCKHLQELYLYQNRMEGHFPSWIGKLTRLRNFNAHSNWFNGSIPSSLANLRSLKSLNLAQNKLSGVFPLSLIRRKAEGCRMYLTRNTGFTLPDNIGDLGGDFTVLNLSESSITGSIPSSIEDLQSLDELYLSDNHISGSIPAFVFNLENLGWLDLSKNSLSGSLPQNVAQCSSLESLELADNQLSGSLPAHLGSPACLPNLQVLDVRNNPELSGVIEPVFFANCIQCEISECSPEMQPHTVAVPPVAVVEQPVSLKGKNTEDKPSLPLLSQGEPSSCCSVPIGWSCFVSEDQAQERGARF